jgi:CubicO group peptidase (beta-lactamase class C family)
MAVPIQGETRRGFERVRGVFEDNFRTEGEVGASFAVVRDGEWLVDLWGGHRDRARTRPWERDTLINVYSTTKGMAALCVAICVDRGLFKYETRVAEIWPEFAQAGKGEVTVEVLLSHQAGLCGLRERISVESFYDHAGMARRLAAMEPWWKPGTANGYHAVTFGFLAGELVRRATGRSLGTFFRDEVARPLGADFWIGLPESEDARVAEMLPPAEPPAPREPDPPAAALAALGNPPLDMSIPNVRAWRAAEIPAANGQGNARALARVYGVLARGGEQDGVRLLSPPTLLRATALRCDRRDIVLTLPLRWAAGFVLNTPPRYGPDPASFGHSGAGGSVGFADPVRRLGFGYAMNQMQSNLEGDPRTLRLIEAVYACL